MIIIKGVKGGIYELIIVKEDPGFVIKYDAKTIGSIAIILITPEDCCASCSDVKNVPIAANMDA